MLGDGGPDLALVSGLVGACEQRIFAIEGQRPEQSFDSIRVEAYPSVVEEARKASRPEWLSATIEAFLAGRGYDADAIREEIAKADVEAVTPAKSNHRNPIPHDPAKYKWRNLIERLFSMAKGRHPPRQNPETYLGFVALTSIKFWILFVRET